MKGKLGVPGNDIEALVDIALKAANVQGRILVQERQFRFSAIHSRDIPATNVLGQAVQAAGADRVLARRARPEEAK